MLKRLASFGRSEPVANRTPTETIMDCRLSPVPPEQPLPYPTELPLMMSRSDTCPFCRLHRPDGAFGRGGRLGRQSRARLFSPPTRTSPSGKHSTSPRTRTTALPRAKFSTSQSSLTRRLAVSKTSSSGFARTTRTRSRSSPRNRSTRTTRSGRPRSTSSRSRVACSPNESPLPASGTSSW